jgi:hypothetical protein
LRRQSWRTQSSDRLDRRALRRDDHARANGARHQPARISSRPPTSGYRSRPSPPRATSASIRTRSKSSNTKVADPDLSPWRGRAGGCEGSRCGRHSRSLCEKQSSIAPRTSMGGAKSTPAGQKRDHAIQRQRAAAIDCEGQRHRSPGQVEVCPALRHGQLDNRRHQQDTNRRKTCAET